VLLDESVLMRPVGGTKVFTDQLRELHRLATDGVIKIRMVPFTLDVPITNNASFDLLSLDVNDVEGMLLYHENGLTDEVIEVERARGDTAPGTQGLARGRQRVRHDQFSSGPNPHARGGRHRSPTGTTRDLLSRRPWPSSPQEVRASCVITNSW
jgi:hypothetical protein